MIQSIQIDEKLAELKGKSWHPIDVAKLNKQIVRLAYFLGEYHWHVHEDADELFLVYEGSITIKIKNQDVVNLKAGELVVIPKGIEHCTSSEKGAFVLMFEPQDLVSTGD